MRLAWLIPLMLPGCGLTHVRPVPERTLQVEGAIGGPIVESWRAPLPDATLGVRYGLLPRLDVGVHVDVAETPRSGVLTLTHCEPVDPLLYAPWEGVITFGRDVLGVPMVVENAVPDPDGCSGRMRVSW